MPYASPYTVADVEKAMGNRVVRDPADFIPRLNEVLERMTDLGLYKGMLAEAIYSNGSPSGIITLGRRHLSIVGYQLNNVPQPVYSQFHEYQELGLGWQDPLSMTTGGLIDLGDGWPTQSDIATPGTLKVTTTTAADNGKTVRILGLDNQATPRDLVDSSGDLGISVTATFPSVSTSQTVSAVSQIYADDFIGPWTLSVTNGAVDTQIGYYEPGEMRPSYRRYKVGTSEATLRLFCRRRFVPVSASTDPVIPGHLGAIEFGFRARMKELAFEDKDAMALWGLCEAALNKHVKAIRGRIQITFPYNTRPYPRSPEFVR